MRRLEERLVESEQLREGLAEQVIALNDGCVAYEKLLKALRDEALEARDSAASWRASIAARIRALTSGSASAMRVTTA